MTWRNAKTCLHGKTVEDVCLECGDARVFYSPQILYRARRLAEGRCVNCGGERAGSPYKTCCVECGGLPAKRRRARLGSKRWKAGKRGRPPLTASKDIQNGR